MIISNIRYTFIVVFLLLFAVISQFRNHFLNILLRVPRIINKNFTKFTQIIDFYFFYDYYPAFSSY